MGARHTFASTCVIDVVFGKHITVWRLSFCRRGGEWGPWVGKIVWCIKEGGGLVEGVEVVRFSTWLMLA